MSFSSKLAVTAVAFTVLVGGTSAALAKAHDQGVADGDFPASTSEAVQSVEGPGISSAQNKGQRGQTASGNGGDNRVEPVVGNGANSKNK